MSKIYKKTLALGEEDKAAFLALRKRFLDDFFFLYLIHEFFEKEKITCTEQLSLQLVTLQGMMNH